MLKTVKKGDELMEFLARYVRKVHSDRYIKNALKQDPGTSFLDIICPSDIAYVICLLINSHEIWIDALNNKNKDGNKQGKKEKKKPLFTAGEGKKRVFGECMWNEDGKNAYTYALCNWQKAYDPNEPQYKMLRDEWEQWVSTKAQTMVLGTWTKKTITSVLATRTEEEVSNAKGTNSDEDEEEDGVGVDDGIEYDTDSENRPMYNSGKWKNSSGTNTGAATNDDDDDASVEAGVAPSVAATVNNLDPLNWDKESSDEDNDEYGTEGDKSKNDDNDSENNDDDEGMDDIIDSLTTRDEAAGRRTTTTTRTRAKAGTETAALANAAAVAEPTSRKRKATGSSRADEQARKGLRQRREKKWEE